MEKVQFGTTVMAETADAIERLAKVEGKTKGELIDIVVAAYDAAPEIKADVELPDDASVVIAIPRDRDMLVQGFGNVIASCKEFIHADDIWKAFAISRQEFQKEMPEFQSAERMRAEWQRRREGGGRALTCTQKGPSLK